MLKIKELRLERSITQSELGKILKVNQTAIGKYERGELEPSIKTLYALSDYFEVSVDYLLGRTDDFGNVVKSGSSDLDITSEERSLVTYYRTLTPATKKYIFGIVENLATSV